MGATIVETVSCHRFRAQRRFAAIQRSHEKLEKVQRELAFLRCQVQLWESWYAQVSCNPMSMWPSDEVAICLPPVGMPQKEGFRQDDFACAVDNSEDYHFQFPARQTPSPALHEAPVEDEPDHCDKKLDAEFALSGEEKDGAQQQQQQQQQYDSDNESETHDSSLQCATERTLELYWDRFDPDEPVACRERQVGQRGFKPPGYYWGLLRDDSRPWSVRLCNVHEEDLSRFFHEVADLTAWRLHSKGVSIDEDAVACLGKKLVDRHLDIVMAGEDERFDLGLALRVSWADWRARLVDMAENEEILPEINGPPSPALGQNRDAEAQSDRPQQQLQAQPAAHPNVSDGALSASDKQFISGLLKIAVARLRIDPSNEGRMAALLVCCRRVLQRLQKKLGQSVIPEGYAIIGADFVCEMYEEIQDCI